jgi:putative membrane protein
METRSLYNWQPSDPFGKEQAGVSAHYGAPANAYNNNSALRPQTLESFAGIRLLAPGIGRCGRQVFANVTTWGDIHSRTLRTRTCRKGTFYYGTVWTIHYVNGGELSMPREMRMAKNPYTSSGRAHFWDVLKCELALFRKVPILVAATVILMLIPSLYTGTYVYSIWDPHANLIHLPVGLTTLDQGVEFQGKTVNLGATLVEELKNEMTFNFVELAGEQEAQTAVRSGRVYFALVVPPDFSGTALSGADTAKLKVYTSSGRSYVGMEIAEQATLKISAALNVRIDAERWKIVLANVARSRDAAIRLRDGSKQALDGARRLHEGLAQADDGAGRLTAGQKKLAQGLDGIDTERLVSAGNELHDNTAKLAKGIERVPVLNIVMGVPRKDLEKLARGASEYQDKIAELGAGLDKASSGANELTQKTAELSAGLRQLHDGSTALSEGLGEIHDGLDTFVSAIPAEKHHSESLAVPVAYESTDLVPTSANGPALTPYFMGLSIWIGVFAVTFLFRPAVLPRRLARASRIARLAGKWTCPFLISSLAAMTLGVFVHLLLKVSILDEVGYYAVLLAGALAFNALILSLNSLLGAAGKLLALVLLVVQISVVGGAYPADVEPPLYQAISPWLPMTHVVFGLRAAMFGSFDGNWARHVFAILPWFFIGLGLGLLAAGRFDYVDDDQYGPAADLVSTGRTRGQTGPRQGGTQGRTQSVVI